MLKLLRYIRQRVRPVYTKTREMLLSRSVVRGIWECGSAYKFRKIVLYDNVFPLVQYSKKTAAIKVSVIIAVKNNETTIKNSIESLQKQTHRNIEIIVVNDGSDDGTIEVVKSLAEKDSRIVFKSNERSFGTSISRNRGLDLSSGEYITFQDGDDFSHPHRILYQLRALLKSEKTKVVLCDYARVSPSGNLICLNRRWSRKCIVSMMFSRRVFHTIGYFKDVTLSEDSDYFERVKAVYGVECIRIVGRIFYKASFSTDSRMFGGGEVEGTEKHVKHKMSSNEKLIDTKLRKKHGKIIAGYESPYVSSRKAYRRYRETYNITRKKPKVSVIVTSCDDGDYIRKCLNSIISQDYGRNNIELIVIDDGSSDETLAEIAEVRELKGVSLNLLENKTMKGKSKSRVKGLKKASGRYVMFVEAKDYLEHHALSCSVAAMREHKVDIVLFDYTPFREDGSYGRKNYSYVEFKESQKIMRNQYLEHYSLALATELGQKLYRRKNIQHTVKSFGEYPDLAFHISRLHASKSIYIIDKNLYWSRQLDEVIPLETLLVSGLNNGKYLKEKSKAYPKLKEVYDWVNVYNTSEVLSMLEQSDLSNAEVEEARAKLKKLLEDVNPAVFKKLGLASGQEN